MFLGFRFVCAAPLVMALAARADPHKMTMDDCVREALGRNGQLVEARGKVVEWEGRLKDVESTFWPKLVGLTYIAPLYAVQGVAAPSPAEVPNQYYRDLNAWGPYIKFQAILSEPITTFGHEQAGEEAAREQVLAAEARYQQTRNFLALDVRRYYLLHIYARSFVPALDLATRLVGEAYDKATEEYASGSGSVTQVDLNKLKFGKLELEKARTQADIGQALALAALKHTMGMNQDAEIETADTALAPPPSNELEPLSIFIARAADHRPEVAELFHAERAAKAFELSERLSSNPTAFAAAQIDVNWTNQWPQEQNPWAFQPFNSITPQVEVGLSFNVDLAMTLAKAYGARGLLEQVEGQKQFASTGIPLEVYKAYEETVQAEALTKLSDQEASAAKKWLVFAGTGYAAGTGEAKDVLEGLVAYMTAKKAYYDALQSAHLSRATLLYSTGMTGVE